MNELNDSNQSMKPTLYMVEWNRILSNNIKSRIMHHGVHEINKIEMILLSKILGSVVAKLVCRTLNSTYKMY